jgi:hypothetical protein
MGTRRRVKHHRKRYRGGEEFIERPFVAPKGVNPSSLPMLAKKHKIEEEARYNAWKANREVEAREDLKGREEDAKMEPFYEKQKRERRDELIETARRREESDIESTRAASEKARRAECREYLRSHDPSLSSPTKANAWLANKLNQRTNPQGYAEVRNCLRILTASKGAGRRKTRRRRHTHRRR